MYEPVRGGGSLLARSLAAPAQRRFRGENISSWRYATPRPELPVEAPESHTLLVARIPHQCFVIGSGSPKSSYKLHGRPEVRWYRLRAVPFESSMDALRSLADVGKPAVRTALNIKVPTVVSTRPGRLLRVSVVRSGTTPGAVHDAETLAGASASNRIATIPRTIAMYDVEWPCDFGIVVVPGAEQVLAVVFV